MNAILLCLLPTVFFVLQTFSATVFTEKIAEDAAAIGTIEGGKACENEKVCATLINGTWKRSESIKNCFFVLSNIIFSHFISAKFYTIEGKAETDFTKVEFDTGTQKFNTFITNKRKCNSCVDNNPLASVNAGTLTNPDVVKIENGKITNTLVTVPTNSEVGLE